MSSCFRPAKKSPVDTQPNKPQAKKNRGNTESRPKENLGSGGQRLAQRQTEQPADQNAHCVEKCAGHTQTQHRARANVQARKFLRLPPRPVTQTGMPDAKTTSRSAWFWVPSLYFSQGIPYVIVMTMSVVMYKRLGISNTDIALYTSWLYLPWVIKPLWSPFGGHHAHETVLGRAHAISRVVRRWRSSPFRCEAARFSNGRCSCSGSWRSRRPRMTSRRTAFTC